MAARVTAAGVRAASVTAASIMAAEVYRAADSESYKYLYISKIIRIFQEMP